ncbi:hypothetical protein [Streptomyces sp. NRRL S-495]|uniref:hypothetical protein n=1 Tax=Streptomyces sp. NRRL S-495 TaxID=1609133 RepID=UPI0005F8CAA2|nr:hypothetical protein [Streptomyces sp. NRRL S-495]KJY33872.1 hypothetical protein VR45_18515 [Streptomyces sp. NRRL S-495]
MTPPRRGRPLPVLLLTAILTAALALTAGCASGPAGTTAAPPPSTTLAPMEPPPIGDVPRLSRVDDRTLPIEAYLLSGEQFRQLDAAQGVLVTRCVRGFGLDYSAPTPTAPTTTQTTHRYDPVEISDVSANGYHSPDRDRGKKPGAAPSLSPDVTTVLGAGLGPDGRPAPGTAAEYRGKQLPSGGCIADAQRQLAARGGTGRDAEVAMGINYEGFERSRQDPRVLAVFRDWSRCMTERGYSYGTPGDALKDPRWGATATPSAEEIATATADVECKARVNVVGVWFTVESAYEQELVRLKQPELAAARAGNDAMLEVAKSVTATGV